MADQTAFYKEVGRRIRKERMERGLTQEELGAAVSLTRTSITNIERGRQKVTLQTFANIVGALGLAPTALLPENGADSDATLDRATKKLPEKEREWVREGVRSATRQETTS